MDLRAFDTNDVSVLDAAAHLVADVDRKRLLAIRLAPTVKGAEEARRMVAPFRSAVLAEQLVSDVLDRAGDKLAALASRLETLAWVPRWESWFAAYALVRLARNLTDVGRHEDGAEVASCALRYMPADPYALSALRDAREKAGDEASAASIGAYLRDCGYGPPIVGPDATDDERKAKPYAPDVRNLAPLSDEELARFLVFTRSDPGSTETLHQARRYAVSMLRRGDIGAARGPLRQTERWEYMRNEVFSWLGLQCFYVGTETCANGPLLEVIEATPEGKAAIAATKKKGTPSRFDLTPSLRIEVARGLAARGDARELERMLGDWSEKVSEVATELLPESPLAIAIVATWKTFATLGTSVTSYRSNQGAPTHLNASGGEAIRYPTASWKADVGVMHELVPVLEVAETGRAKCKVCKAAIEAGAWRLAVRDSSGPPRLVHLACAVDKKYRDPLESAIRRDRRAVPKRDELLAQISAGRAVKKAKKT